MGWRDNLRDASFRGVPFKYRSNSTPIGRRNQLHEYPKRDNPYGEDLGRKARQYTLDAFVLGDDYLVAMKQLIAALDAPGPGRLVHPTLGEMDVIVTSAVVVEDFEREGGLARFSLTFSEAGAITAPTVTTDTSTVAGTAANTSVSAVQSGFYGVGGYSLTSTGSAWDALTLAKLAISDVGAILTVIRKVVALIDLGTSLADALTSRGDAPISAVPALALADTISGVSGTLSSLVKTPSSLASSLTVVVQGFQGTTGGGGTFGLTGAGSSRSSSGVLTALGGTPFLAIADAMPAAGASSGGSVSFDVLPTNGTSVDQAATNRTALVAVVRQIATIEAVRVATTATYDTATQALAVRDDLASRLDAEMLVSSSLLNISLRALRAAMVDDIATRAAALPTLITVTVSAMTPALVLAAALYDDPTRAADIVTRNGISRPGFVPAGSLTVLSS